jgi:ATP-dependent DNA ligase
MKTSIPANLQPMDALSVDQIPVGAGWQYEPKWDGFRCLAFREGKEVKLRSKSGQPLERYFPELVAALQAVPAKRFVLDGEIIIPVGQETSFDHLLMRIHPAATRIQKLAVETPARLMVFDLLADPTGRSILQLPLQERRRRLESFACKAFKGSDRLGLSPATTDVPKARRWFDEAGRSFDGLIAKRLDAEYRPGERTAMQKIKPRRTADCVVGGFRYAEKRREVGSLLLGLYDQKGLLHHVGFCSGIKSAERPALTRQLEKLVKPPGFTGQAPGGPSRWSTKRSAEWQPLRPSLIVEVEFDHVTGQRFRHGTKFIRWRPDKKPALCGLDQLRQKGGGKPRPS